MANFIMTDNIYECFLEEIRKRYEKKEISALVGSGFSKNVYTKSPDWDELLYDMVFELFDSEINTAYTNYLHQNSKKKNKQSFAEFSESYAKLLSVKLGYLNIVSKYIDRYGFRECVELYIEKHIPYLNLDEKLLKFGDGRTEVVSNDKINVHKKLLELRFLNAIYTTNYDNFLEETAIKEVSGWNVVDNSSDVRLSTEKKSIIKIHGNIRRNVTEKFCFDGHHSHRYIISKEDYDNYPKTHEAFMQLMRISLLRESFVLFGFSGRDPNFIAWVKWVRDVLIKSDNNDADYDDPNYYKIFLFAVDENEPNDIDNQFYRNHRIKYIPILSDVFLSAIGINVNGGAKSNLIGQALVGIYDYLSKTITYHSRWSNVLSYDGVILDTKILEKLTKEKINNRLLKDVSQQESILSKINNHKDSAEFAKLYVIALQDTKYYVNYYSPLKLESKIKDHLTDGELKHQFDLLNQRYEALKSNGSKCDFKLTNNDFEADYNNILKLAFSLNFKKLKQIIALWQPQGYWIQNKAVLLALFDDKAAKDILLNYITIESNAKEKYYSTTLLNIINRTYPAQYHTTDYENQGLDSLWDIRDSILKTIKINKSDIKPYGSNITTRHFGLDNIKYLASVRLIQFLLDSGLPVQLGMNYCVENKDWYIVSRELYQSYPYAVLWFTLQCSDESILKRIGQEYAYSDNLQEQVPLMLEKLFCAYFCEDTPDFIKTNILKFIPTLFVSVSAEKWEKYFRKIWITEYVTKLEYAYVDRCIKPFISACLPYITSDIIKNLVISDCITNFGKENNTLINAIYNLNPPKSPSKKVLHQIDGVINNIAQSDELLLLANLYSILTEEQIRNIELKIIDLSDKGIKFSHRSIPALAYFAKNGTQSKDAIECTKQIIMASENLWNIGIDENKAWQPNYIKLSDINKWIEWNKAEVVLLLQKLSANFETLKKSVFFNKREDEHQFPFSINYIPLLTEMYRFLTDNNSVLTTENNFNSIFVDISTELNKRRKFDNIEYGLWSSERSTVINAINEVINIAKTDDIVKCAVYIDIMLDRIVFKLKQGLESSMDVAFYYIKTNHDILLTDGVKSKLLTILRVYSDNECQKLELDVSKAYKELISVAKLLLSKGVTSEWITYWLKRTDRFIYTE